MLNNNEFPNLYQEITFINFLYCIFKWSSSQSILENFIKKDT